MICDCTEANVSTYRGGSRRLEAASLHNCDYIKRRNAFIPQAQQIAKYVAPHGGYGWGAAFIEAMDRLVGEARASGLL